MAERNEKINKKTTKMTQNATKSPQENNKYLCESESEDTRKNMCIPFILE